MEVAACRSYSCVAWTGCVSGSGAGCNVRAVCAVGVARLAQWWCW